jgi:hypothetical protein
MGYENTSGMPFSGNLAFNGGAVVNGEPVGRTPGGYKDFGGIIASSDSNNNGLTANFGVVVSTNPSGDNALLAIGCPAGYVPRGIIQTNNGVMQNEPAKSGYMFPDIPVTVGYEGTFRYLSWTKTQTGAIDPTVGCQIIYRATTGGTAGCDIGALEFLPAGTAIPTSFKAFPGYVVEYDAKNGVAIEINFDNNADAEKADILPFGTPFKATATLTSAAAATPVTLLADSAVPAGKKVYITGFFAKVNGATAWGTTANCYVKDSASSPVTAITMAVAALTANAFVTVNTANITIADPVALNTGLTAAKGLTISGNANGTGSDLVVTVTGFIA